MSPGPRSSPGGGRSPPRGRHRAWTTVALFDLSPDNRPGRLVAELQRPVRREASVRRPRANLRKSRPPPHHVGSRFPRPNRIVLPRQLPQSPTIESLATFGNYATHSSHSTSESTEAKTHPFHHPDHHLHADPSPPATPAANKPIPPTATRTFRGSNSGKPPSTHLPNHTAGRIYHPLGPPRAFQPGADPFWPTSSKRAQTPNQCKKNGMS